jgi:mannitol-specific phosphotransferase system IIBC component
VSKIKEIMKKYMVILPVSAVTVFVSIPKGADAQLVVGSVISSTVGRVIRAIDLEVQRMQNQTIWLQNAQKALENQLSKLKLDEISGWSQKQKDLFSQYYQELWNIKTAIAYYSRISDLTQKQVALVNSYNQAWALIKNDKHFTADELSYMTNVYSGILQASVKDLDQILSVIHANKTQMPDAKRMEIINKAADHMDTNYNDLQQFNTQNEMLSLQKAQSENEVLTLKKYYGIE